MSGLDAIRERRQLASDLHASVAQTLFAIGVEARIARELDAPARDRSLRVIEQLAGRARDELYETLTALNQAPADASLPAQLDSEVQGFREATGSSARFVCLGRPVPLGPLVDDLLRDTLAEALRNVRKHASASGGEATPVTVELTYRDDAVELQVGDDGGGAQAVERRPADDRRTGYLGLLAERAAELRGTLVLHAAGDGAATLRLCLPRSGFTAR